MDPKACLDRAQHALDDKDLDDCSDALRDYRRWRKAGGFEPRGGDAIADDIAEALASELEARAQSLYQDPDSKREGDL